MDFKNAFLIGMTVVSAGNLAVGIANSITSDPPRYLEIRHNGGRRRLVAAAFSAVGLLGLALVLAVARNDRFMTFLATVLLFAAMNIAMRRGSYRRKGSGAEN